MYDALEGSGFYTYWDASHGTYRQVYFEDERSAAAKYDYAIISGYAGSASGRSATTTPTPRWRRPRGLLDPNHEVHPTGRGPRHRPQAGVVWATLEYRIQNAATSRAGTIRWVARDPDGRPVAKGTVGTATVSAGKTKADSVKVKLGPADDLRSGTWTMTVYFVTADAAWESDRRRSGSPSDGLRRLRIPSADVETRRRVRRLRAMRDQLTTAFP